MKKKQVEELLKVYTENMTTTNVMVREKIARLNELDNEEIGAEKTQGFIDQYYKDFAEITYGFFEQITRIRRLMDSVENCREQRNMVKEYSNEFRNQLWSVQMYFIGRQNRCRQKGEEPIETNMLSKRIEELAVAIYILENLV